MAVVGLVRLAAAEDQILDRVWDFGLSVTLLTLGLVAFWKGWWVRGSEVAAADARTAKAEARADKEAEARQKIQDAWLTDLQPALFRTAMQGERMVEAATHQAEMMEKLIDAFLDRMKRG